ncbi:MAG: hypothetical protein KatS3mg105_1901 [Gemmatales bacterium]|nr:MAG: hypothetical protein KatS3mg105_1901 [Gemmatales bacterium]
MRRVTFLALVLAGIAVPSAQAQSPLRLVPQEADLFLEVPNPAGLIQTVLDDPLLERLRKLDAFAELQDFTNVRRFYQLVAYYEKELGAKWPEVLDQIAGKGVAFAVKIGPEPAPFLVVLQGKNPQTTKKFFDLSLNLLEQELNRQEAKNLPVRGRLGGADMVTIGNDLRAVVKGSNIFLSNREEALKLSLELLQAGAKAKGIDKLRSVADARRLLPKKPLVWFWLNFEFFKNLPQADQVLSLPRNDIFQTVFFGSFLDLVKRSDFMCASISREKSGYLTTIRLPAGRKGMPKALGVHVPMGDEVGSLPTLQPKGTIYSNSSYFDIAKFWTFRKQLFTEQQVEQFEKFDKNSARALLGNRFSDLIQKIGAHHRFVVVNQPKTGYKKQPKQKLPAFAYVVDLRDPKFGKTLNALIRAGALLATTQIKMNLVEEKEGEYEIVGYRFSEDRDLPQDRNGLRFNFSPCFATIENQFMICSTLELGHELARLLAKEAKTQPRQRSLAVDNDIVYGNGLAELVALFKDQLMVQTALSQAVPPEQAEKQVDALIDWIRGLGRIVSTTTFGDDRFSIDIRLIYPRKPKP